MRVDPNAPVFPCHIEGRYGIPIRLEIASRLLAGIMAHPTIDPLPEGAAESVLRFTDALIAAYNGGETS